ncbi:CHASE domain-containing protein [Adhaeribacter aquaticus]|uniref:CHASE domain-containing protein n=1 Tax=Adhaeribacter aquaticus TaxID=299567 RepID=UPI00041A890F|nr:CHASE domain-containing protein [Adhaeribacter aquaticus]
MFKKIGQFLRAQFTALVVFVACMCITVFGYFYLKEKARKHNEVVFANVIRQTKEVLVRRINNHIQILKGGKGLFLASDSVSRENWRDYVNSVELQKIFPGLQGIGFSKVIKPADLEKHIQDIKAEGFPDYTVTPVGPRSVYTSILYIEPFTGNNLLAFGYDMFSDPTRRKAMELARDTGKPAITGRVSLVQSGYNKQEPAFLIYMPVYKGTALPATIAERRELLIGYVYFPFRARNLMDVMFFRNYSTVDIDIYDGTSLTPENLLYDKHTETGDISDEEAAYHQVEPLQVLNRTWSIRYRSLPNFNAGEYNLANLLLGGGTSISFLLFFAVWSVSKLRRSNRLRQTITNNATSALFMMDAQGYCTFMNPAAAEMTGFTFEEIRQKPLHYMIHHRRADGSFYPMEECPIDRALPTNNDVRAHEDVFIRKDGSLFQVTCAARPIFESGTPVATVVEVRDITEERKTQMAFLESESRFQTMADSAPVMIWISDTNSQCIYVNKQWTTFTGQTLEEATGNGYQKVIHPDDLLVAKKDYLQALKNQTIFQQDYRIQGKDGTYRWMASTATPRFNASGEFLGHIGSIVDITERKEAERKIKENAALLQRIFLEVPASVALVRASDQVYVLANARYNELHGNRELLYKNIRHAHPDLEGQGFFETIEGVISSRKAFVGNEMPATIENLGVSRSGYFNVVFQPLFAEEGHVAAVLLFIIDVTELVESRQKLQHTIGELRRTNAELRRTNTDLDNFVYTASHDLKAPIANLEGLTNDIEFTFRDRMESEDKYLLELLTDSIHKLKRTVNDLTDITKVQKDLDINEEVISFDEMYEDIKGDLKGQILTSKAIIKTDFAVPEIIYARKNLRSIMYNLISNAIKYRSPERVPEVTVSTEVAGGFIRFTVKDNGLGIRDDQQHKLFSMFRRVHTHVDGSGIGLYIVKRIVENNGGKIVLESEENKGSVFSIYLKRTAAKA